MRGSLAAALVWVGFGAAACDVFVSDIGHEGEPCAHDGSCYGELGCVDAVCVEVGAEGEPCDPGVGACREEACDGSLFCVDGECVAMGGAGEPCWCEDETVSDWGENCIVDCASYPYAVIDPHCDDGLVCSEDSYTCVAP